jgi:hypothetical protein
MELNDLGLRELSLEEKIEINGGSKIGDALRVAWDSVCEAAAWVCYKVAEWWYNKREEILENYYNGS